MDGVGYEDTNTTQRRNTIREKVVIVIKFNGEGGLVSTNTFETSVTEVKDKDIR